MEIKNNITQIPPISDSLQKTGAAQSAVSKPVQYSNNQEVCSSATSKAVRERFDALLKLNKETPFIDPNAAVAELYKKTADISKLFDYIDNDPVLSKLEVDYDNFQDILQHSIKEKYDFDFSLESKKEALKKLSVFGTKPQNTTLFKVIGEDILSDIVLFNSTDIDSFTEKGIKNITRVFDSPDLKAIAEKIRAEDIYQILKQKNGQELITKNIELLEQAMQKPEFAFLKDTKSIDSDIIRYNGDLKSLLSLLKSKHENLLSNEKLKFGIDYVSGESSIKTKVEHSGGLIFEKINYYDKELKLNSTVSSTEGISKTGEKTLNMSVKDLLNNTQYRTRQVFDTTNKVWVLTSQIKEVKDKEGKITNREITKLSNVKGVYNIKTLDSKGKIFTKSSAVQDSSGTTIVKRLTSPDGTQTLVDYHQSPDTKKSSFSYKIIDKSGKLIAKKETETEFINNLSAQQTIDGKKYKIYHLKDEIKVFDEATQKTSRIDLNKVFPEITESLRGMMKKLPAPELIAVSEKIKSIKSINEKKANFNPLIKKLETSSNPFVFLHELGHAKIEEIDSELIKIFDGEKAAYKKIFPKKISNYTSYFTTNMHRKGPLGGLEEASSEINAIINTPLFPKWIMTRAHYLQENFPKTIAFLLKHKI